MTRISLIRHGETQWNRDLHIMGQFDIPLDRVGSEQAHRTAEFLAEEVCSAIYSSDLSRALQTDQMSAARHGLNAIAVPGLREAATVGGRA